MCSALTICAWNRPSPFPPAICRSFSKDPKLGPGTPLYNMLAMPEDWGDDVDNSPCALFDRLFDEGFRELACILVPDGVHLCKICAWIIGYITLRQGAAEQFLEAVEAQLQQQQQEQQQLGGGSRWRPPFEPPIKCPQAYDMRLLKDKACKPKEKLDMVRLEAALAALVNHSYTSSYIARPEKPKVRAGSVV